MIGRCLKWLFGVVAVGIFLFGLLLWWPLRMGVPWLNQQLPPGWRIEGVSGSLWSGTASQLMVLGTRIGPWQWQLDPWRQRLNWQLGKAQESPWEGHLDWLGGDQWRLSFTSGDMRWIDTRLWGVQLAGVAQGPMDVSSAGVQCLKVTQGQAAWTPLKIVWPPQSKGQFQRVDVTLACRANHHWSLDAVVQEEGVLSMSAAGRQIDLKAWQWSLNGWISPESRDHPAIKPLRTWLAPNSQGQFQQHFRTVAP